MRYHIEHLTHYVYSAPVSLSMQLAHLRPRETARQRLIGHSLRVLPASTPQRAGQDYFGNPVVRFELATPHNELRIVATSEVTVEAPPAPPEESPSWESVRAHFALTMWGETEDSRAGEFLFPSTCIPDLPELRAYATPSFTPEHPLIDAAVSLMHRIHEDFEFDPAATHIATPVATVLEIRRGVCQDFAHLMVGCLRALGLPARYVSGYLLTEPPPGKPRLVGADASHAWVALYIPRIGWIEFDPTNDRHPDDSYITLGWGRDFADVSPLRGVIQGGGEHEVHVGVTVTPLDHPVKTVSG